MIAIDSLHETTARAKIALLEALLSALADHAFIVVFSKDGSDVPSTMRRSTANRCGVAIQANNLEHDIRLEEDRMCMMVYHKDSEPEDVRVPWECLMEIRCHAIGMRITFTPPTGATREMC